jgi:phytoene dehydrogenase-like protein
MDKSEARWSRAKYDAVVVGAGPNGLSAAIELARSGCSVLVVEARSSIGGGARTSELTLPGFFHDVCSTVHPLAAASPFFASLSLERFGLTWIHSPAPLAHVLSNGQAVLLERSLEATLRQLGSDADSYRRLLEPFAERFSELAPMVLSGLRWPESPLLFARFGASALRSLSGLVRTEFRENKAPALLAGIAAHAMVPLGQLATASFALVLASAAHSVGWPVALGGSQAIVSALQARLLEHDGEIVTEFTVAKLHELPPARAYLFDVTPRQLLEIAGSSLSPAYNRRLERFRYGQGVYKMDWALSGAVPWRDPACARAATVHLSGDLADVAAAERSVHAGALPEAPFVLVVQPSLFDGTRAPLGQHTLWAYCHVPRGSELNASSAIEGQIERFAPGFRQLILARRTTNPRELEDYDANYVGGDIAGGASDLGQLFFRPVPSLDPYATSAPDIFLCSSSTPPGGGVHGMCGYWAARSALRRVFRHKA